MAHITSESVDNAVKILADHIVENKTDVIRALNNSGVKLAIFRKRYGGQLCSWGQSFQPRLPRGGSLANFFRFQKSKWASPTPPYRCCCFGRRGRRRWCKSTWLCNQDYRGWSEPFCCQQASSKSKSAMDARANLEAQRIEAEAQVAQQKAKQEFAFNLLKAQQDDPQDRTTQNLILLLGTLGFLGLAYYATTRNTTPKVS